MPQSAAPLETRAPASSVCPALVPNVRTWSLFPSRNGRPATYIIGEPETNSYIVVPAQNLDIVQRLLHYFDGQHTLEWITEHFTDLEGRVLNVYRLYEKLAEAGLLSSPTAIARKVGDIEAATLPLADVALPKLSETAKATAGKIAGITALLSVPILLAAGAFQILALISHAHAIPLMARESGGTYVKALCAVLVFSSVVLHECSHGLAAMYFRLSVRHIRIALYLGFIPIVYLRINGLYTLRPRQRIVVWLAGPYANLTIGALLSLLIHLHCVPAAATGIFKVVILSNITLFLLNLFPFLPTDGYYILSTLFRSYNVRSNAWRAAATLFRSRRFPARRAELFYLAATLITISTILLRRAAMGFHAGFWSAFFTCVSIGLFIGSLVLSQKRLRFSQARSLSFAVRGLTILSALLVTRVDRLIVTKTKIQEAINWLTYVLHEHGSSIGAIALSCAAMLIFASLLTWKWRRGSGLPALKWRNSRRDYDQSRQTS